MKKIKIALVHEMLVKMGGAERVLESLQKLYPEAPIYTLAYDEKKCGTVFPKNKVRTSRLQKFLDWGVPRQFLVQKMPRAIEDFDFSGFDLVISSSSAFAHGIITPSGVPHICYVHAPMRYVWDYTHEYMKEKTQGWKKIFRSPLFSLMHSLRIWDYISAERPDVLLANSKTTQKRIEKYWRRGAEVIYPPVDTKKCRTSSNTLSEKGFYLIVSALEPFKKIDIAVKAFATGKFSQKKLFIIGEGSDRKRLESLVENNKKFSHITFLGKKSDSEVVEYMKNCKALIFPGLEDFGITPVEAMSAGKPVIFYSKGGVAESVIDIAKNPQEATGVGFSKQTPESLHLAIDEFESQEYQEFFSRSSTKESIQKRAEAFSQKVFLTKIQETVEEILKKT